MRFTQDEVDTLREDSKRNTEEMKEGLEDLSMRVAQLEKKLETAVKDNIKRLSLLFPPGQFCVKNNFA